jgi:hypothetical protein
MSRLAIWNTFMKPGSRAMPPMMSQAGTTPIIRARSSAQESASASEIANHVAAMTRANANLQVLTDAWFVPFGPVESIPPVNESGAVAAGLETCMMVAERSRG